MPAGRSVQFRGIDNVVGAYENMAIPKWGLFQSNQFLGKYDGDSVDEGAKLLEQMLQAFDLRSADTVTYTLCVYDGLAAGEKIKSTTKYDGSFNFRLVDTIDGHNQQRQIGATSLENRIAGLEQQLQQALADKEVIEDAEPELSPVMQMLMKIVEHPQVQQKIAGVAVQFMDKITDGIGRMLSRNPVAKVAGVETAKINDVENENVKLQSAINILAEIDPQLGTHLLKLAEVAKADPAKYNGMISMLNLL
jgi:hypothetical protein